MRCFLPVVAGSKRFAAFLAEFGNPRSYGYRDSGEGFGFGARKEQLCSSFASFLRMLEDHEVDDDNDGHKEDEHHAPQRDFLGLGLAVTCHQMHPALLILRSCCLSTRTVEKLWPSAGGCASH